MMSLLKQIKSRSKLCDFWAILWTLFRALSVSVAYHVNKKARFLTI